MPIADLKAELGIVESTPEPQPARAIVVLIDDDQRVLTALRLVLRADYDVRTCDDPVKGVELVAACKPDVVVLDIKMPTHDGFWVFGRIRTFNPDVPIIINSAYQEHLAVEDAVASFRPFAYLNKGGASEFLATVRQAAEWSRAASVKGTAP